MDRLPVDASGRLPNCQQVNWVLDADIRDIFSSAKPTIDINTWIVSWNQNAKPSPGTAPQTRSSDEILSH
jgi:hypothetical protein